MSQIRDMVCLALSMAVALLVGLGWCSLFTVVYSPSCVRTVLMGEQFVPPK